MTKCLRQDGYRIYDKTRITGDGYYEIEIFDPACNLIELIAD